MPRHLIRRTSSFVRRGGARKSGAGGTKGVGGTSGAGDAREDLRRGRGGLARVVAGQVRRKRVKVTALEGHVDRGARGAEEEEGGEAQKDAREWGEGETEGEGKACRRVRRWAQAKRVKQGVGGGRAWNEGGSHGRARRVASHMWHAKRFHMADTWGYRLASRLHGRCGRMMTCAVQHRASIMCGAAQSIHHVRCSTEHPSCAFVPSLAPVAPPCACRGRGSRAVVEAVGRAAVLHDASYHSAIQLTGAQADISALLACCTSPGALPLASRPAPATPHTAHAARTDRGDGGAGEAARGEAWRRGVLELRALVREGGTCGGRGRQVW
ncbi:unnamed protein product [Closterium sp. Naga37s-1]|nr:unnamed protein product [Closterium sp. Naga37s-1]